MCDCFKMKENENKQIKYDGMLWYRRKNGYYQRKINQQNILLHKYVFEKESGMVLPTNWEIHHRDFNSDNNCIENLQALPKWMHKRIHSNSEITKEKQRRNNKGENNPLYGKKHSEETKRKISEAQTGSKNHMFGKAAPNRRAVYCINTDTVYQSIKEASLATGISSGSIIACCKNKTKKVRDLSWQYVETED